MKTNYITIALLSLIFCHLTTFSQTLNQPANWPDTNWTVAGTYTAAGLINRPDSNSTFTFDDDVAGSLSNSDDINVASPIIDLTAAHTAGETWINISGTFVYTPLGNDILTIEYWDADALSWVNINTFIGNSTSFTDYKSCLGLISYTTTTLNILNFTTTQLSGFKYRFTYDDNGSWQWGFCFSSPTITSSTPPTCPLPSNLLSGPTSSSTAILNWTENGSATLWQIEWGLGGFIPGTGTTVFVSNNPDTILGLPANSNLEYYVRSICSPGDSSGWVGPQVFETQIDTLTVPYFQNFETGGPGSYLRLSDTIESSASISSIAANSSSFGGLLAGNSFNDWTGTTTGTTATQAWVTNASHISSLDMIVDATGLTNVKMDYDYRQTFSYGDKYSWGRILVNGVQLGTSTNPLTTNSDPFQTITVDLSAYAGTVFTLSIQQSGKYDAAQGLGGNGDEAYIDNISLYVPAPNDLKLVSASGPTNGCGLGLDSVRAVIVNHGTAPQYSFSMGFSQDGVPISPELVSDTLNPGDTIFYTFNTLGNFASVGTSQITAYTILPSDSNSSNDSASTQVSTILTISSFPYDEDFESGPGSWVIENNLNGTWVLGTPAKLNINSAASGSNSFVTGGLTGNYNNLDNSWIESPCFDFSGLQNPQVQLNVWWESEFSWDGANLQYSIDGGLTWSVIGAYNDPNYWYTDNSINGLPVGTQSGWSGRNGTGTTGGSNGWKTASHSIKNLAGQSIVKFRIMFGSDGSVQDEGFAFDDFRIFEGPVLAADTSICSSDNLILFAGIFDTYAWTGGTSDSILNLYADTLINGSNSIIVSVTDSTGYIMKDTINITVDKPILELGIDSNLCIGSTFALHADSSNTSFLWDDLSTSETRVVNTTVLGSYTYSVLVVNSNGCARQDSVTHTIVSPIQPVLGNDTVLCYEQSIILNAGIGFTSYVWENASTIQLRPIIGIASGAGVHQYYVTTEDLNGCIGSDTIMITIDSIALSLGPDTSVCSSATITLSAGTGFTTYNWSNGSNTNSLSIDATTLIPGSHVYGVTVENSFGCMATDSINLNVLNPLNIAISGVKDLCFEETITVDAGPDFSSYDWSNFVTTQTQNILGSSLGIGIHNISVSVMDSNMCVGFGSDTFEVFAPVLVDLGVDTFITDSNISVFVLDVGSGFVNFEWNIDATNNTRFQLVDATNDGEITVVVTDSNGCIGRDTIIVDFILGVKNIAFENLKMYPNPATNELNIEFSNVANSNSIKFSLYSMLGEELYSESIVGSGATQVKTINISRFASGMYVARFEVNGFIEVMNFIIQ